jgi:hypothetical protein
MWVILMTDPTDFGLPIFTLSVTGRPTDMARYTRFFGSKEDAEEYIRCTPVSDISDKRWVYTPSYLEETT